MYGSATLKYIKYLDDYLFYSNSSECMTYECYIFK